MRYCSLLLVVLLAACASPPPNGGKILITTVENDQPIDGVSCAVSHNTQRWDIVTPETLEVGAADGDLNIICNKEGYRSSELRISPTASGSGGGGSGVSLGLGSGGIGSAVGLGLSLPFGGRASSGHYPPDIKVNMTQQP